MRHIEKTEPPKEFEEYCKTPGVCYEGLDGEPKHALRKRLLDDQGYLCCYCGCRIMDNNQTKIEHIKCQERYGYLSLDFNNMLASCDGGELDRSKRIRPKHQCHCDVKKSDRDIPLSPLDNEIESLFTYFDDGTVKGTGDGKDLIEILGLNVNYLVSKRKSVFQAYKDNPPDDFHAELMRLKSKRNGEFEEFCFALEQYIKMHITDYQELGVAI